MTKPALADLITLQLGDHNATRVEYQAFLRGRSEPHKLSALAGIPFELVSSQESRT